MKTYVESKELGTLEEIVTDRLNGIPCEMEYKDKQGKTVGYWAYGNYDPAYEYQGV